MLNPGYQSLEDRWKYNPMVQEMFCDRDDQARAAVKNRHLMRVALAASIAAMALASGTKPKGDDHGEAE